MGSSSKTRNHALTMAWRGNTDLVELRLGLQDIPVPELPQPAHGHDAQRQPPVQPALPGPVRLGPAACPRLPREHAPRHELWRRQAVLVRPAGNVPGMPMDTEGRTSGPAPATWSCRTRDTLRVGELAQRYRLDDWWLPGRRHGAEHLLEHPRRPARPPGGLCRMGGPAGTRNGSPRSACAPARCAWTTAPCRATTTATRDANAFNARDRKRRQQPGLHRAGALHAQRPGQLRVRLCAQDALAQPVRMAPTWPTGGMAMRMINLVATAMAYVGNQTCALRWPTP